ncbi:ATP-binding protein [Streptomyces sp. CRN 30]|uniref:ATP-binding protein n=1 Tax=Streptomyces sp. CRN 30 TaxID=3075613 RepID=UPI002A822CED|nr:ATP-binding protein [Streptomyces sp. CRN 30]
MTSTETFRIPRHKMHVPIARQHTGKTLTAWGVTGESADVVLLLANELVTNAVTHCRTSSAQVRVTLTLHGTELLLEVADPDRDRLPRLHASGADEEGGRGLALVAALADAWGCRQEPYVKCVWARLTVTEEAAAHVPATVVRPYVPAGG